jgi:hypothetical protein
LKKETNFGSFRTLVDISVWERAFSRALRKASGNFAIREKIRLMGFTCNASIVTVIGEDNPPGAQFLKNHSRFMIQKIHVISLSLWICVSDSSKIAVI